MSSDSEDYEAAGTAPAASAEEDRTTPIQIITEEELIRLLAQPGNVASWIQVASYNEVVGWSKGGAPGDWVEKIESFLSFVEARDGVYGQAIMYLKIEAQETDTASNGTCLAGTFAVGPTLRTVVFRFGGETSCFSRYS